MTGITNIIKNVKGTFAKNVMMITGGAAFAQLLNIIISPVITRIYTPDEYGLIAVYTAVLGGLGIFGSMNFEMAIPIAENDEKAINVMALSVLTLSFSTIIVIVALLLWDDEVLGLLKGDQLLKYSYLIPIGLFLLGLYKIFTQWAYRNKDFKAITKTKFSQSILQNLTIVGLGLWGKGAVGLLIGRILGQSAGITNLIYPLIREDKKLIKKVSKQEIIWSAKRYKRFPLYTTPRRYLGDINIYMPVLFMTSFYGSEVVGLFALANSVIQLPMNLIGNSISNVYYAECASLRAENPKRIKELSNKLLKTLVLAGLIPLVALIFFGPVLFSFVFGSEWIEAGVYARLLSIAVFSRFIFKPISNIFDIFEKQKVSFWLNVLSFALVMVVFGASKYLSISSYWTVGLYSVSMSIIYYIQYVLAQKIINEESINQVEMD